jgi:hypothetical protein
MFRPVAVALLGCAAIVFGPDVALAQRKGLVEVSPPHYRHGFWLEGTFGWGEESYKFANDPYNEGLGKPTFGIHLGGTVNPHLRLGFEWTIWVNNYQDVDISNNPFDVTETLNSFMATARVFPSRNLGLFLKGGAGLGLTYASVDYGNSTSESGFATNLGAGWEIKLGHNVFLTPGVDWYQHSFQKRDDDTLYERLFNVSLAVTWQPGR